MYGSDAYLYYTNTSEMFTNFGIHIYTLTPGEKPHREAVSYTDGSFGILENRGNNSQLYVPSFNRNFVPNPLTTINYNPLKIDPTIINEPLAPRTPLENMKPITMIAPADTYTSAALLTGIPNLGSMSSSRKLFAKSGIGPNGVLSIANCADISELNPYARDAREGVDNVIEYDVVNATNNSTSVIGGPKIFRDFKVTVPAAPQIACFDNGTVVVAFLDDGTPATFTFNFLRYNVNPATSPTPTPSPAPGLLNNVTIDVIIPPDLGTEFIPITGQIVAISNTTATVQLVNTGGYIIVFRVNGSAVPLFTNFTPNEIYSFNIAKNASAPNDPFVLTGCDTEGRCSSSTAKTSLHDAFAFNGISPALTIVLSLLGVATVVTVGGVVYVKIVRKTLWAKKARQAEKTRKAEKAAAKAEGLPKPEKQQHYDWNIQAPETGEKKRLKKCITEKLCEN